MNEFCECVDNEGKKERVILMIFRWQNQKVCQLGQKPMKVQSKPALGERSSWNFTTCYPKIDKFTWELVSLLV